MNKRQNGPITYQKTQRQHTSRSNNIFIVRCPDLAGVYGLANSAGWGGAFKLHDLRLDMFPGLTCRTLQTFRDIPYGGRLASQMTWVAICATSFTVLLTASQESWLSMFSACLGGFDGYFLLSRRNAIEMFYVLGTRATIEAANFG